MRRNKCHLVGVELELSSLTVQFKVQAFGLQFQFKRLSFKLKKFYSYIPIKMTAKNTKVGATQNSKSLRLLSYELAIVNWELELEGSKFLVLTSTYEGFKRPVESWFEFEKYDSNVLKQYAFLKMKASREFSQLPDGEKSFALYWKQGLIKVLQNKGVLSEKIRMEA